jgi:hypothetical protein
MTEAESTNPLDWFVNSLLESAGRLMLIVDHMSRYPVDDPGARSVDEVLRELLTGTLERCYRRRHPADFATAATLLAEARTAIARELVLVEPEPGPSGPNGSGPPRP